jgi:hypothetical protein
VKVPCLAATLIYKDMRKKKKEKERKKEGAKMD